MEVAARALARVKVDCHSQAPAFAGNGAKDEVLKLAVRRRSAPAVAPRRLSLPAAGITDFKRAQVSHLEFLADGAALLVPLDRRQNHTCKILIQRRGASGDAALFVVS